MFTLFFQLNRPPISRLYSISLIHQLPRFTKLPGPALDFKNRTSVSLFSAWHTFRTDPTNGGYTLPPQDICCIHLEYLQPHHSAHRLLFEMLKQRIGFDSSWTDQLTRQGHNHTCFKLAVRPYHTPLLTAPKALRS